MTKTSTRLLYKAGRGLTRIFVPLAVTAGFVAPASSESPPGHVFGVDAWQVYGTASVHGLADSVPGGGTVTVEPRAEPGEPWSSGAGMPVPGVIAAGERVTAMFWARASQPTPLTVALQARAPHYTRFATAPVVLKPEWQQVSVSGVAPVDFVAGSQLLSVPLGRAKSEVTLGPVVFQRGAIDGNRVAHALNAFRPAKLIADVRIPSDPGVVLAGTLHLPAGRGSGPFPLAVLIQGFGPNGRGGFTEIIKRLAADGIAALEYDKRGIGQSTGTYEEDLERLTADAAAAVAAMRRRPDIDGGRIALVGHSQGGVLAPAVAAVDPKIATVITLGGSVGDGLPYLRRALQSQMAVAGRSGDGSAPAIDAAITLLQARIDGKDAKAIASLRSVVIERFEAAGFPSLQAEAALAMIDIKAARKANKLRSASDLKTLQMPVLALFGAKDTLVVASHEAPAAREVLAKKLHSRVVVLDGLNHWFQEGAITGTGEESSKLGPNLSSPRAVVLVADWLRDHLVPEGGAHDGQSK